MRMFRVSHKCLSGLGFHKSVICAAVVGLGVGSVTTSARAALLLSDNFTVSSNENDPNQSLPGRQAGGLAPLTYSTNGGNVQTGNTTTMRSNGDGNYLLLAFDGKASPDQNFNSLISQGGMTLSFDVDPEINAGSTDWSSVDLGESAANRFQGVSQAFPHFGMLFRANGQFQAFDGSNVVGSGPFTDPTVPAPGGQDSFATVSLTMTDLTDGNPFDGTGVTVINAYSPLYGGGLTPFFSYTETGGGYTDNYITLSSTHIGGFDNLAISTNAVPEPMSIGSCLAGGIVLLGRRRRRMV